MKHLKHLFMLLLLWPGLVQAQFPWSNILTRNRAIDWSNAGLPATFPDGETTPNPWTPPTRAQCGPALTPTGGNDFPQVQAAMNGTLTGFTSCVPPYAVVLGPGNFTFSTQFSFLGFPMSLGTRNYVTLRGSGPMSTKLTIATGTNFQTGSCCQGAGAAALTSAAANFTQGATTLLLQGATASPFAGAVARLFQCDNGFLASSHSPLNDGAVSGGNGGTATCTGAAADTNSVFHCSDPICNSNGNADSSRQQDQQTVVIVSATNTSGSNWTVTISPGLYLSDWTFAQGATLSWNTGPSNESIGVGVEDMTIVPATNNTVTFGYGGYASWLKGVRMFSFNNGTMFKFAYCSHCLAVNNYWFENNPSSMQAGFTFGEQNDHAGDGLWLNNIITQGVVMDDGPDQQGNVVAYNYNRDSYNTDAYQSTIYEHAPGSQLMLRESNQWNRIGDDDVNGTHNFGTDFRNYQNCGDDPYFNPANGGGIQYSSFARFYNSVGNVIGLYSSAQTQTLCATYQGQSDDGFVWNLNGNPTVTDATGLTVSSLMRWGNVSQVLQSTDTPANSGIRFVASEVPTSIPGSQNAIYQLAVPANHSLPCSFFLKGFLSTSCTFLPGGGTNLSWWKVCIAWTTFPSACTSYKIPPFPVIGPDVLAANGAPRNYVNDIPAAVAWKNLPVDTSLQSSFAVSSSSWSSTNGGTETLTVATMPITFPNGGFRFATGINSACLPTSGISYTGRSDNEIIITFSTTTQLQYALPGTSGPASGACNGTVLWPDVRQFDERIYSLDSGLPATFFGFDQTRFCTYTGSTCTANSTYENTGLTYGWQRSWDTPCVWANIEAVAGTYNFDANCHSFVQSAVNHGAGVTFVMGRTPASRITGTCSGSFGVGCAQLASDIDGANTITGAFVTAWANYMSATWPGVVWRIEGRNEANLAGECAENNVTTFCSMVHLVKEQQDIFNAAKAVSSSIQVLCPSDDTYNRFNGAAQNYSGIHLYGGTDSASAPFLGQGFVAAGGLTYCDTVNLHGYFYCDSSLPLQSGCTGGQSAFYPDGIVLGSVPGCTGTGGLGQLNCLLAANGKTGMPVETSETSWGKSPTNNTMTDTQKRQWIGRSVIYEWNYGQKNVTWYQWDCSSGILANCFGTLFGSGVSTVGARALGTIQDWLINSTSSPSPCTITGGQYSCSLTIKTASGGSSPATIVFTNDGTTPSVSTTATNAYRLNGTSIALSGSYTLDGEPTLLSSSAPVSPPSAPTPILSPNNGQVGNNANSVQPPTLTFGKQGINTSSMAVPISINNCSTANITMCSGTGNLTLTATPIVITGTSPANNTDFTFALGTCSASQVIASGGSCSPTVTFKPTSAAGTNETATLTVSYANAPSSTMILTGTSATVTLISSSSSPTALTAGTNYQASGNISCATSCFTVAAGSGSFIDFNINGFTITWCTGTSTGQQGGFITAGNNWNLTVHNGSVLEGAGSCTGVITGGWGSGDIIATGTNGMAGTQAFNLTMSQHESQGRIIADNYAGTITGFASVWHDIIYTDTDPGNCNNIGCRAEDQFQSFSIVQASQRTGAPFDQFYNITGAGGPQGTFSTNSTKANCSNNLINLGSSAANATVANGYVCQGWGDQMTIQNNLLLGTGSNGGIVSGRGIQLANVAGQQVTGDVVQNNNGIVNVLDNDAEYPCSSVEFGSTYGIQIKTFNSGVLSNNTIQNNNLIVQAGTCGAYAFSTTNGSSPNTASTGNVLKNNNWTCRAIAGFTWTATVSCAGMRIDYSTGKTSSTSLFSSTNDTITGDSSDLYLYFDGSDPVTFAQDTFVKPTTAVAGWLFIDFDHGVGGQSTNYGSGPWNFVDPVFTGGATESANNMSTWATNNSSLSFTYNIQFTQTVTVLNGSGTPISGATVTYTGTHGTPVSCTTNTSGICSDVVTENQYSAATGTYTVTSFNNYSRTVSASGFGTNTTSGITITAPNSVTVTLTSGSSPAAAPTFSPVAGSYVGTQIVTMSSTTAGFTITSCFDTTNTCTPSTAGSTFTVSSSGFLRAFANATGFTQSSISSAQYTITALPPIFSPTPGAFIGPINVTLSTMLGSVICYTTNGTIPATNGSTGCTSGTLFSAPIPLTLNTTIQAIAGGTGLSDSAVVTGNFAIQGAAAPSVFAKGSQIILYGGGIVQ